MTLSWVNEAGAVALLRRSVQHAQRDLLAGPPDAVRVNEVLATLASALAPGFPHLYAVAEAQPLGLVAAVLDHLRVAYAHAASGHFVPAVRSVVTAAASALQFGDDVTLGALEAEAGDRAH